MKGTNSVTASEPCAPTAQHLADITVGPSYPFCGRLQGTELDVAYFATLDEAREWLDTPTA